jgi:enterochelin esterase-like enzyme
MRRMNTRQAINFFILFLFLAELFACTPTTQATAVPNVDLSTPSPAPTFTATLPPTQTPTPTPLGCLSQPGEVRDGKIDASKPAQEFKIYLPPCYDIFTDKRYPVLYLLHGQTYIDDQWPRLGAVAQADKLILSGKAAPFIIVFPDDRYWNLPAGPGFGIRFVELVVPYIDQNYRTMTDRKYRALGGLSRGGGWTIRLGFEHWDMFGILGLHSPVIFVDDGEFLWKWLDAIPRDSFPRLWIDIGEQDGELTNARTLENLLTMRSLPHEFHLYQGAHTEQYWSGHVDQYMKWYAESWNDLPTQ